jgi:hypothetical protein
MCRVTSVVRLPPTEPNIAVEIPVTRLPTEPNIAVEIEALVTLLYMLVVSHEDDFEFMGELG